VNTAVVTAPVVEATAPGWLAGLRCVFLRDLRIAARRRTDALGALLRTMAPGVVWVAALLACTLSLARLFADDHQDGTLEQLLIGAHPLPLLVLGKVAAHWCSSVLPLVLVSPLLALQFDLSASATGVLLLSLLLGTPVLSLVGAMGAALTLGLRGAGVLMSLLVLPLLMPVLIFGAGAVQAHSAGLEVGGHFSLLGAMLLLSLLAAPLVASAALRISME